MCQELRRRVATLLATAQRGSCRVGPRGTVSSQRQRRWDKRAERIGV